MMLHRGSPFLVALMILSGTIRLRAEGTEKFSVKPPASWVQAAELPQNSPGVSMLLDDHQTRVTDRSVERYVRHTQLIATQKDLEDFGHVEIEFEPSYQSLAIHFIQIRRSDKVIDALRSTDIRVLHREEELEEQIFNGTVQAVAILQDLRVGDIVDVAYTVTGQNPVMGGKYSGTVSLDLRLPVKYLRSRLLWPSKRKLFLRSHNTMIEPKVTPGVETEYVWERHDVVALPEEDNVPSWYRNGSWIDVSEFENWRDVVQWALPLYTPGSLSHHLAVRIEAIAKNSSTPADRVVAALRLVQDEVRYLGIEMGPHSHQPTAPSKVLERRFGDCKDKALLLTTILRELGIDAAPALVDTEFGKELHQRQPSPIAFDHVIVTVRLDGKTYWLDGTNSFQRGRLQQFYSPNFGKALVLREETTSLEDIPVSVTTAPSVLVSEKYQVQDTTSPVSFTVTTTYIGEAADDFRYHFARTTLEKLSDSYLNYYADENPGIEKNGLPEIKDDEADNVIIVRENYTIPDFWNDSKHYLRADRIAGEIEKPRVSRRSLPLAVRYPLNIAQRIEIEMPGEGYESAVTRSFTNETVEFHFNRTREGKRLVLDYSLKTRRDHVPAKEVQKHLATLDSIWDSTGYNLPMQSARKQFSPTGALTVFVLALGMIGGGAFFFHRVMTRRRAFHTQPRSKLGSDPSTPIPVLNGEAMLKHRALKCRCGFRLELQKESFTEERILFDGERITVLRGNCTQCRTEQDVYFKEA